MSALRICVLSQIPNLVKELRRILPNYTFTEADEARSEELKNSEILIADFDLLGPVLFDIPNIKWVQGTWAGVDALMPYIKTNGPPQFPIVRFSGKHFGRLISEYVVACIVNQERDLPKLQDNHHKKVWTREGKVSHYRTIGDLNIGIMGIGNIGSRLGHILKMFGANVLAYGRRTSIDQNEFYYITEYYNKSNFTHFLESCDYIINTLPKTEETNGVLDKSILEHCKEKKPIFINVGRGSIISDDELIRAIEKNWLSVAYLDVFNIEPLPNNSRLWNTPQIKISPHVAAMSRGKDIAEEFSENLKRFHANEKFPTILDTKAGY